MSNVRTELALVPSADADDVSPVERAVRHIQALDRHHRLGFALAVGQWLYEQRFLEAAPPGGSASHQSLRVSLHAIAADPRVRELGLSRATLHNFVRVHAQLTQADPQLRMALRGLSLSHQVRLLPITTATEKRRFAEQAATGKWTVRQLEDAILATRAAERASAGHERPGRRPLPIAIKRSRAVVRAMDGLLGAEVELATLTGDARAQLRRRLAALLAALNEEDP